MLSGDFSKILDTEIKSKIKPTSKVDVEEKVRERLFAIIADTTPMVGRDFDVTIKIGDDTEDKPVVDISIEIVGKTKMGTFFATELRERIKNELNK